TLHHEPNTGSADPIGLGPWMQIPSVRTLTASNIRPPHYFHTDQGINSRTMLAFHNAPHTSNITELTLTQSALVPVQLQMLVNVPRNLRVLRWAWAPHKILSEPTPMLVDDMPRMVEQALESIRPTLEVLEYRSTPYRNGLTTEV